MSLHKLKKQRSVIKISFDFLLFKLISLIDSVSIKCPKASNKKILKLNYSIMFYSSILNPFISVKFSVPFSKKTKKN
jgi:hypothetical protein